MTPGRHDTLLRRTPLRTVHDSFPSHRSSLSKAKRGPVSREQSRVAFAIRICSRRTSLSARRQSMASHFEDAETHQPTAVPPLSFASPHTHGSAHSLTTKDLSDVGPLSCRVTFKPVSRPLQPSIRFFRLPKPGIPIGSPRGRLSLNLKGRNTGFHVPLQEYTGLGAYCRPGGVSATRAQKL